MQESNDGIWTNRLRINANTGKFVSNFEKHYIKHKEEFNTKDDYRIQMNRLINNPLAEIYEDKTGYLIFD